MYLRELRNQLSQGDIFAGIELLDSATPSSPLKTHNVIVISHTCEILKPSNSIVLVCAIRSLSDIESSNRGHIKNNRIYNAMYLSAIADLSESFVDFRYTFRINKLSLEEYIHQGRKIASLNDEAQLALTTFFYRFLIRPVPSTGLIRRCIEKLRTLIKILKGDHIANPPRFPQKPTPNKRPT